MKYSEKMKLLLNGVKMDEIKALEEEEAKELEALKKNEPPKDSEPEPKDPDPDPEPDIKSALELVKELEGKLKSKDDEITKLNQQFADLNNKRSVDKDRPSRKTADDVMKELFHAKKKEE